MEQRFAQLAREREQIIAALWANVHRARSIADSYRVEDKKTIRRALLLNMAEGLITAHKVAKVDDEGLTLDLIEDALRHVGERLAKECSDGRSFSRKRISPF